MSEVAIKKKNIDMTQGSILGALLLFSIPLFIGNVFQLLYNFVDSFVVGQFVSDQALAAVSSSGSLANFLVSFIVGITAGAGILIAQHFGSRNITRMQNAIHTLVGFGLIAGLVLTVVGYFLTPHMLVWMNTDEEVLPQSTIYFKTYFLGIIFTVLYNIGSSVFRAVGDSRHPLYYLILSSLLNVALDLLFVIVFKMGVLGVALATILSQAVSAAFTMVHLMILKTDYRIDLRKIRIHKEELFPILRIGLPNGLQNSIVSLANVFIQSNINSFGKYAQAGCGTYQRIEGFATMPSGSFSTALSNFVGQNMGAGEKERVKKGAKVGILTSMITCEIMAIILFIFAPQLINVFSETPDVAYYGISMTRHIVLFYALLAFSHGVAGVLRGAGMSIVPMLTMIICWCGVRVFGIPVALGIKNDITVLFMFYPLTWSISFVVFSIYLFKVDWIGRGLKRIGLKDM